MASQKTIQLIDLLRNKTLSRGIKWEEAATEKSYQASFPAQTVVISERAREFVIMIMNETGTVIESTTGSLLSSIDPQAHRKLEHLYNIARESALGVDQAIDELLKELSSRS